MNNQLNENEIEELRKLNDGFLDILEYDSGQSDLGTRRTVRVRQKSQPDPIKRKKRRGTPVLWGILILLVVIVGGSVGGVFTLRCVFGIV